MARIAFTLSAFRQNHTQATKVYEKAQAIIASPDTTQIAKWQAANTANGATRRQILNNLARLVATNIAIPDKASAWTFEMSWLDFAKRWHNNEEVVAFKAMTVQERGNFRKDWSRYVVCEAKKGQKPGAVTPKNPKAKPQTLAQIEKMCDHLTVDERAKLVAYLMASKPARKTSAA